MAVCSQIHTKHINTLCGQNVELLKIKLVVHIVTTGLQRDKSATNAQKMTTATTVLYSLLLPYEQCHCKFCLY